MATLSACSSRNIRIDCMPTLMSPSDSKFSYSLPSTPMKQYAYGACVAPARSLSVKTWSSPSRTSCTLRAGIAHALNECCPSMTTLLAPQASTDYGRPWRLVPVAGRVTGWYLPIAVPLTTRVTPSKRAGFLSALALFKSAQANCLQSSISGGTCLFIE